MWFAEFNRPEIVWSVPLSKARRWRENQRLELRWGPLPNCKCGTTMLFPPIFMPWSARTSPGTPQQDHRNVSQQMAIAYIDYTVAGMSPSLQLTLQTYMAPIALTSCRSEHIVHQFVRQWRLHVMTLHQDCIIYTTSASALHTSYLPRHHVFSDPMRSRGHGFLASDRGFTHLSGVIVHARILATFHGFQADRIQVRYTATSEWSIVR